MVGADAGGDNNGHHGTIVGFIFRAVDVVGAAGRVVRWILGARIEPVSKN
jgi:hypothetical protein